MSSAADSEQPECFVIGLPRSGTTVFKKMLESHSKIANMGEIFSEGNGFSYFSYLRGRVTQDPAVVNPSRSISNFLDYLNQSRERARKMVADCRIVVLDVKYSQSHLLCEPWWSLGAPPRLFSLIREHAWRVIDVRRSNILSQIISNRVAIQTNIYHSTSLPAGERSHTKIHLDSGLLRKELDRARRSYQQVSRVFAGYDRYTTVGYEEMFDPSNEGRFSPSLAEKMSQFLGVDNTFDCEPKLTKVLEEDALAHIENAQEVRDVFSRWQNEGQGARS